MVLIFVSLLVLNIFLEIIGCTISMIMLIKESLTKRKQNKSKVVKISKIKKNLRTGRNIKKPRGQQKGGALKKRIRDLGVQVTGKGKKGFGLRFKRGSLRGHMDLFRRRRINGMNKMEIKKKKNKKAGKGVGSRRRSLWSRNDC
jgi:hypothetical protein